VMDTLSKLSYSTVAQQAGIKPFPTEESLKDEDIYSHLKDLMEEGQSYTETLESIEKVRVIHRDTGVYREGQSYTETLESIEKRRSELHRDPGVYREGQSYTETLESIEKVRVIHRDTGVYREGQSYTETLESIEKYFLNPLKKFVSAAEIDKVFVNIPDLVKVHKNLMLEVQDSIVNKNALNLYQIFIAYKDRLLIYGIYCSNVEISIAVLDFICKEKEDVRLKLEKGGELKLRFQRNWTFESWQGRTNSSVLNCMLSADTVISKPEQWDEFKFKFIKFTQHIFLFDVAVIVCKRRGDNYEMKDVIDLNYFKITNNPTQDGESKKVSPLPPGPVSQGQSARASQPGPVQPGPVSQGQSVRASPPGPVSKGQSARASPPGPVSQGQSARASQPGPVSQGQSAKASPPGPVSQGQSVRASQPGPVSQGQSAKASPPRPVRQGQSARASQPRPVSQGQSARASQPGPVSQGQSAKAK
ncbi:unnamed protein product, partial [Coregonus sp. 'balchen']